MYSDKDPTLERNNKNNNKLKPTNTKTHNKTSEVNELKENNSFERKQK